MTVLQTSTGLQPRTTNAGDAPMPLPTPQAGEAKDDFIARCLKDAATQDITGDSAENSQQRRQAACFRQWDDAKAAAPGDIETKSFAAVEIKDAATGQVESVVATLDLKDRDGDWIPTSALEHGAPATISMYDHDSIRNLMLGTGIADQPPVGKGTLSVEEGKAVFRGQYFMDTQRGREAFLTMKALGANQDWSFGYRKLQVDEPTKELRAKGVRRVLSKLGTIAGRYEVSPVPMGGGIGTRTVSMKTSTDQDELQAQQAAIHHAQEEAAANEKKSAAAAEDIGHKMDLIGQSLGKH